MSTIKLIIIYLLTDLFINIFFIYLSIYLLNLFNVKKHSVVI